MTVLTGRVEDRAVSEQAASFVAGLIPLAFRAATRKRERDPHQVSLSGLGACTRQVAYKLAGAPVTDPLTGLEEDRTANLGTWQHQGLLPRVRALVSRARSEMRVVLSLGGLELPGRLDLWVPQFGGGVIDLKTTREWGLDQAVRRGMRGSHRSQVRGYALACVQAGRPCAWYAVIYLDRATGDHEVLAEPFDQEAAQWVCDRVEEIKRAALNPRLAPREERGPGLSPVCDSCPWLRSCWGPTAVPGLPGGQSALARRGHVVDAQKVAAAAQLYDHGRDQESAGRSAKEFARAILSTTRAGTYGAWELSWGRRGRAVPDVDAMIARYEALGWEIPKKPGSAPAINVKRRKEDRR